MARKPCRSRRSRPKIRRETTEGIPRRLAARGTGNDGPFVASSDDLPDPQSQNRFWLNGAKFIDLFSGIGAFRMALQSFGGRRLRTLLGHLSRRSLGSRETKNRIAMLGGKRRSRQSS